MKTTNTNQALLKLSLIVLGAMVLAGCGASKTGGDDSINSSDYASRNHPGQNSSDDDSTGGSVLFAECTSIPANSSNIEGRLTSYYHPTTNAFIANLIRLKFDRLPVDITTTNTVYIQMFRWYADGAGKKAFNGTPVSFNVINKNTKAKVNTTALKTISKAVLQNLITNAGLGTSGVTLNNFFEKHILILEGMDLTYDAVTFAVYDSSKGTAALSSHDVLLPAFAANPADYNADHPASILRNLHPYASDIGAGLTDEHFRTLSMDNCIP